MRAGVWSLVIFIALAPGMALAAPTAPIEKPMVAKVAEISIAPHRAIYDMTLASVKNGSNVSDVSGKMIFEWADACDGWAIQQNLQLHFLHDESEASNVASNEVTWEAKDGKRYNFNIRRLNDGKETENYRGKATLTATGGKAVYSQPEGRVVELSGDTLFPSGHTRLIIASAMAGERFFTRRVFDGVDEDGQNDVSVYIGTQLTEHVTASNDASLASNPLLAAPAWPVHMAFFKLKDETGEPDYEMDITLAANGVVRSMHIDYGDFSVTGTLKAIEALPLPHC